MYFGPILRHFRVKLGVLFGNLRFCWAYIGPLRAYVRPYNILGQLEGYMLALFWLPLWQGSQLAVDTTLVSPLTSAAEPRRRGGRFAGTALRAARQTKERTYPELVGSRRCRLVVLAMEDGGRWSAEAAQFLRLLAQTKAQSTPRHLRQATVTALISRWSAILTHAGMQALASSLLSIPTDGATNGEGALPPLG